MRDTLQPTVAAKVLSSLKKRFRIQLFVFEYLLGWRIIKMGHCKYQYHDGWKHDDGEFGGRRDRGSKKILSKYTRRYTNNSNNSHAGKGGVKDSRNHSRESGDRSSCNSNSATSLSSISWGLENMSLGGSSGSASAPLSDKERKQIQKANVGKSRQRKYSFDDIFSDEFDSSTLALGDDSAAAAFLLSSDNTVHSGNNKSRETDDRRERSSSFTSCDSRMTSVSTLSGTSTSSVGQNSASTSKPIPLSHNPPHSNSSKSIHPMGSYFATGKFSPLTESGTPISVTDGIRSPPTPSFSFFSEPREVVINAMSPLRAQQGNVSVKRTRDKNSNYIPKMIYQRLFSYQHYFNRNDACSVAPVDERWFQYQLNAKLSTVESADFVVRNAYVGNLDDIVSDYMTSEVISSFATKLFHEDQVSNASPASSVLKALYKTTKNVYNKDGKSIRSLILESIYRETENRADRVELFESNSKTSLLSNSNAVMQSAPTTLASTPDRPFSYCMVVKSRSNSLIDEPEVPSNLVDGSNSSTTPSTPLPSPHTDINTFVFDVVLFITRQNCVERSTMLGPFDDNSYLEMGNIVNDITISILKCIESPIDSNFSHVHTDDIALFSKVSEIILNSIECFDKIDSTRMTMPWVSRLAQKLCDYWPECESTTVPPVRRTSFERVADLISCRYGSPDATSTPEIERLKAVFVKPSR